MIDIRGPFRNGAVMLGIAGLFCLCAGIINAVSGDGIFYLLFAVVSFALGYGLLLGWRWLAHLTFLVAMIAGIVAMGDIWHARPLSGWLSVGVVVSCWLAAAALFLALWAPKPSAQ